MRILDSTQIQRKIDRLAMEILERHVDHGRIVLIGINDNGVHLARALARVIEREAYPLEIVNRQIKINPAAPLDGQLAYEGELQELNGEHVILTDDVANTGRTAYYAASLLSDILPNSLEVAVLIDRQHKRFPVCADYVGLSLATSLHEEIRVYLQPESENLAEIF